MKKLILISGLILIALCSFAFAEIQPGEYGVLIDGVVFPGKVILADYSFFSIGEGWCLLNEDGTTVMIDDILICGQHVWNSEQDVFLFAGQELFTVPGFVELTN